MIYKTLWNLLIDRDMKHTNLPKNADIHSSLLAYPKKDKNVMTGILLRICDSLNVDLKDIAKSVPDKEHPML